MAKLLVGNEWYEGLASEALLEAEYEQVIKRFARDIFPQWRLVPFKVDVEAETGIRKPDLALIDHAYRSWWVVEVELAHHSFPGHVLPQVDVFRSGHYTSIHADVLANNCQELDPTSTREMLLGAPPRVLVVVNLARPEWIRPLAALDALLCVIEVFRSQRNQISLRLNGERPQPPPDVISICRRDRTLRRMLLVDSPALLGGQHGSTFEIEFGGTVTIWRRMDLANQVYLSPVSRVALIDVVRTELRRLEDGRLMFGPGLGER